jgi:acetyl-CoA synthetase
MKLEVVPSTKGNYNLANYDTAYETFNWSETEENFTWSKTGRVNAAFEAIDKHAETFRKNKIALYYRDTVREEKYTFKEMKELSNKAGNVLKNAADVEKGDRLFVFMPRTPELYFVILGAIKLGAIVGPLFEAFMEGAVKDRLEDSEAKVIVTTPELLDRIPVNELPLLKHIIVVGNSVDAKYIDFLSEMKTASKDLKIEWVDKTDGLLLNYTSGSTGRPK